MVDNHSVGVVESPVGGKAYVSAHESTGVCVVPTRADVAMPVTSYSLQKVGDCVLHDAPLAQFMSYGTSGQSLAVDDDKVEVRHPVGEVLQRPLTVKAISAAGLVEYTDPSRCPYQIFDRYPPRM